jgi:hypothetical protein
MLNLTLLLTLAAHAAPLVRLQKGPSFISPSIKAPSILPSLEALNPLPQLTVNQLPVLSVLPKVEISASVQLSDLHAALSEPGKGNEAQTTGGLHFDGLKAETGDVLLGTIDSPSSAAGERTLKQWRYLAFSVVAPVTQPAGDFLIDGLPAEQSKLEYKRVTRVVPGTNQDKLRHDYSFLALGATPPGQYIVTLPGGQTLTINVAADKQSPERGHNAAVPEPEIGGGLNEEVKQFLSNHMSYMGKHLAEYERYVRNDALLDEAAKAEALGQSQSLRDFYAEAASGRRNWTLGGLAAQALARDRAVMEAYFRYLQDDPTHGRAYVGFALDQTRRYREAIQAVQAAWSQVDSEQRTNPLVEAYTGVLMGWYKVRYGLSLAWTRLKIKLSRRRR